MKKIISIILCGAFLFSSCEDFLSPDSPSVLSDETVFKTKAMTKAAVMGVYASMCGTYVYGQKLSVNWQGMSDIETNSGFSETNYNNKTSDAGAGNFWSNWYNKTTQWAELFKYAELATTAVEGIRNSPLMETEPEVMKRYLGEALVMRAIGYFELMRWWGDVPFKSEPSNSDLSNVYMGKVDKDVAYAVLIEELQEAVEYLPWVGEESEYTCERITKGFAKGFLARVALFAGGWSVRDGNEFSDANVDRHPSIESMSGYYVGRPKNWRDYYAIAEQQCAEIIGSSENPHGLDPDYGNLWKTVCRLGYNQSNENLFEVAFGEGQNGDIGSLMGYNLAGGSQYGSRGFGGNYVASTAYYFYSFDREDTRRDYACTWLRYTADDKEELKNDILNVSLGKWNFFWTADSYKSLHKNATARVSTGINWIVMRYPDILLMFAEARYGLLSDADAVSQVAGISARRALEQVRERAFGAGSPKVTEYDSDFFEAIVNERAWEFGGEGIRKQDLVRWGLLNDKIEDMKRALCYMMDGSKTVQIFDKTYQPADFPKTVYYKFKEDGVFVDASTINFYEELPEAPGADFKSTKWCAQNYLKPTSGDKTPHVDGPAKVLLAATGLMADYDYSSLFNELQHGGEIRERFVQYETGNKVCNYRHLFSIYYEDIYESKGYLKNAYGY